MNTELEKSNRAEHVIEMRGREQMEIRGVRDVVSFDEQAVILETVCGSLAVEGSRLHIHVLNLEHGIVAMDGTVNSIGYFESAPSEAPRKSGFFARIFR